MVMSGADDFFRNRSLTWKDKLGLTEDLRLHNAITSAMAEHSRVFRDMEQHRSLFSAIAEHEKYFKQLGFATSASASVSSLFETLRAHEIIPRLAIGPLADLKERGLFRAQEAVLESIGINRNILQNFEAGFRLPGAEEAARLAADFHSSAAGKAFASLSGSADIQRAMENMRSPWLDVANPLLSSSAFSAIQEMGRGISIIPPFDHELSAALRLELGDWREHIEFPNSIYTDLQARSDFYASLGVNSALTVMPAPAFRESLTMAGLIDTLPPPIEKVEAEEPEQVADDEESGFRRTNAAHDRLQRLETELRGFIDEVMTEAFGPEWPKHRVPADTVTAWRERKQSAQRHTDADLPLIAYADFTDYERVICKRDNWKLFERYFDRVESARESLQRLYPIRIDTMHSRLITQDDELFLAVEQKRLVRAMRRRNR